LKTAILGTIALAALSSGRLATASTIQYRYNSFTDLGHVDAVEINDSGQVTGRAFVDQASMPFVTGPNGANLRLISLAPGHNFGFGYGINNLGQVTGWSAGNSNRTPESPFVTAPNGDVAHYFGFRGFASDINDRGQVVGTAHRGLHDPADTPVGLFLANMNDGSFKIVSSTVFSFDSSTHLNNLGQIAGEIFVGSMIHVFVTDPDGGALHDISAPRDFSAAARDINNSGDVVGTFDLRGGSKHAFVSYDGARRIDIGALAGGGTGALGINDAGTIVGYSGPEGFIYTPETGLQNLNSFIDPSLGIDIVAALDINNAGEILAKTSDGAEVILFPRNSNGIPDAGSTAMLFACALVGLSVLRRCLVTRCRKFIR
jgi:probable HAF family extracellular repeat protein